MRRAALFAALALASAAAARDVRWVSLYTDRDGETLYDPASVTRTGARAQLTLRAIAGGGAAFSTQMRVEVDCKAQTMGLLSMAQYGAGPQPTRTRTVPADKVERQPLFAGEDMAAIYRVACPKGAPLPKPTGPTITVAPPPAPAR